MGDATRGKQATRACAVAGTLMMGALALLGCAGTEPPRPVVPKDGFDLDAEYWKDDEALLRKRAAFEMECPSDRVQMTVLTTGNHLHSSTIALRRASQVGVEACGHRAVYVYLWSQSQWLMNTESPSVAPPSPGVSTTTSLPSSTAPSPSPH